MPQVNLRVCGCALMRPSAPGAAGQRQLGVQFRSCSADLLPKLNSQPPGSVCYQGKGVGRGRIGSGVGVEEVFVKPGLQIIFTSERELPTPSGSRILIPRVSVFLLPSEGSHPALLGGSVMASPEAFVLQDNMILFLQPSPAAYTHNTQSMLH